MIRAKLTVCTVVAAFSAVISTNAAGQTASSGVGSIAPTTGSSTPVDYLRDIRPILSDSCYACHGPDAEAREADLRLDQRAGAFAATGSGDPAIAAGKPGESEALRRITSHNPDELMPPVDSGKKLTGEQIDLIRRWIQEGAAWQQHWAFVPPQRPAPPRVGQRDWPRNAIDSFILSALEQKGWQPSRATDRESLIRRVTLHLTGLPPTMAEVDAFLADESPAAYERVVDRLLASPHYGENMARYWLDAVRYGDTHGLHLDNYREMWLYRDWVIQAFNSNLSYDQFVIQQLAGDLLPDPTVDQRIATGFCRAHVSTNEGGSIEEEVYVRNVVDRVSTTGTVFLGMTLGCAACHDHKYDPVTQKEFYQLFAFFNSLDGPSLDGNVQDPAPALRVPGEALAAKLAEQRRAIVEKAANCASLEAADDAGFTAWLARWTADELQADGPLPEVADGLAVHCTFDVEDGLKALNRADQKISGELKGAPTSVDGQIREALRFASRDDFVDLGNVGDFQDDQAFSYGAWIKTEHSGGTILAKTDSGNLYRGYELTVEDGLLSTQIGRRDPGYLINVITKQKAITPHQWHHVFITYDGSKQASGTVVYVDGARQEVEIFSDSLKYKGGIRNSSPLLLGRRSEESAFVGGQIDDARVYSRRLTDADVQAIYLSGQAASHRALPPEQWSDNDLRTLRRAYLLAHDSKYKAWLDDLDRLGSQLQRDESQAPTTLIFREQRQPREAFVLIRGQYDQPGERVERITPEALPPMTESMPRNRLGFARWLVAREHPLTSRVAVNRLWQQLFGVGLVRTSEDFGNQGAVPSNPELLDWLAVEFRESGWNVKSLVKQMVTSAAYRQSSRSTAVLSTEDPENRLLARGPRFRLDAESLRDQALSVSGLLVDRLGGPSVKPPQPEGLWEAVGFIGSNTAIFVPDSDFDKTHRRTLYTFLKRTAPAPEMSSFDAPSRESPCMRRERTNTPMQALLLLNDPQYVEAARGLARRVLREQTAPRDRAAYMYRLCTARHAGAETIDEMTRLYEDQLARYRRDEVAATLLIGADPCPDSPCDAAELASWTVVGNLVLNLDEVINVN